MAEFLIVGCGFTGRRVLRLLESAGHAVAGLRRSEGFDVNRPADIQALSRRVTAETRVLISIPTQRTVEGALFERTPDVADAVRHASRVVYLSTTGVYGAAAVVDENTPAAPRTLREQLRVTAEQAVAQHARAMILRPAAIYGPFRGAHVAIREGRFALPADGDVYTSRIHVHDLARLTVAALVSELTGAWPVADEEPSTARAIAEFCCALLRLPLPPESSAENLPETRRANRRVDGSALRAALGISLLYPSYRTGIPACIAEESAISASSETGSPGSDARRQS